MEFSDISRLIIGAAIEVHRYLGPGLLESVYQTCLLRELDNREIPASSEVKIPIQYKGEELDCGFRADLIIDNQALVELKAVDKLLRIHESQVLTYMKLTGLPVGLLINFNASRLVDGVRSFHGLRNRPRMRSG